MDRPINERAHSVLAETEDPTPFRGNEYICPNCRAVIPTRKIVLMAKPPRFAHLLNDIIRCCYCNFLFSYRGLSIRAVADDKGHAVGTAVSG
jgi:hypothetical protein